MYSLGGSLTVIMNLVKKRIQHLLIPQNSIIIATTAIMAMFLLSTVICSFEASEHEIFGGIHLESRF